MSIYGWQGSSPTEYGLPLDDSYLWDDENGPDATERRRCLVCGRFFSAHPDSMREMHPACKARRVAA